MQSLILYNHMVTEMCLSVLHALNLMDVTVLNFSDAMTERKFPYQHMLHVSPPPPPGPSFP
jgi:hypothetical protein